MAVGATLTPEARLAAVQRRIERAAEREEQLRRDRDDLLARAARIRNGMSPAASRWPLLAVPVAWVVDYLLLAGIVEATVSQSFREPWAASLARGLFPAVLVGLELLVAELRAAALAQRSEHVLWGERDRSIAQADALAWAAVLVGPIVVLVTYLATRQAHGANLLTFGLLTWPVILSVIAHWVIVFQGGRILAAADHTRDGLRARSLERRAERIGARAMDARDETAREISIYVDRYHDVADGRAGGVRIAPFSQRARRLGSDAFGYAILGGTDDDRSATPVAPAGVPGGAPAAAEIDAETEVRA